MTMTNINRTGFFKMSTIVNNGRVTITISKKSLIFYTQLEFMTYLAKL